MLDKLQSIKEKHLDLEQLLADPKAANDQARYRKLNKEYSDLKEIVQAYDLYAATKTELENEVKLLRNELETYRTGERVIDIIYPNVEQFVQWEEMKYSIRSLEKNLIGVKFK
jgi:protein subunit release factor A